ncbi:acyl-CoA dehydrogenase family protein [Nonomuraea sp. NPDC049649]|uniref:acyl-CoA dehydrogenase family protein n=1 Tax=Nonomuraea sp. NPDC049649 TaxID=3155776 RepID=UPI003447E7BC
MSPPRGNATEHERVITPEAFEQLRLRTRRFIDEELAAGHFEPQCDSWLIGFDREFSRRLAAQGMVGMTLPERFGGAGLTALHRFVVIEELLAAGAPLAAHWFAERQVGPAMMRYGSEDMQKEWLPRIARGEVCFAIGLSEPDAGSDLAAVRTRAEPVEGGFRLHGTKIWSSNAHRCDAIVVLARTSDEGRKHAGLTQLVVRLPDPTVTVSPIQSIDGQHHFNEVVFEDTLVGKNDVLGTVGAGWRQVVGELAFERSGPERYLSTMPLLRAVVAKTNGRHDLDRAVADLLSHISTLRHMSEQVARSMSDGSAPDPVAASVVKDLGTRLEVETVDLAHRLARAVDTPSPRLTRLLREARVQAPGFTIRGGASEILRAIIAKELVR